MKISLDISAQQIANLMISCVEGNDMTRAWCAGILISGAHKRDALLTWYAQPNLYEQGFTIEVLEIIDENKEPVGKNLRKHRCNRDDFAKGLALMAVKSPRQFAMVLNDDGDAITADVFLQCVALGEIVYG